MAQEDKEIFFKINMLEQYMKNIHQQIEAVENEILELNSLNKGLEELKNSSGKEVFSTIGKNIFIKTKIISEELLVGVGEKNLVKKSIPETSGIIIAQIKKLEFIKKDLLNEMEKLNREAEKILRTIEKQN